MQTTPQFHRQTNRRTGWFSRCVAATVFAVFSLVSNAAFAQNDLQVANLSDAPDPVVAGGTVTYTLRVANNAGGAVGGAGATVTFSLPANKGLTYLGVGPGSFAGATCVPAPPVAVGAVPLVVSCTGITFGVPGSPTDNRTLVFLVRSSGLSKPSFTVTPDITLAGNVDPDPANNGLNDTEETFVLAGADLALAVLPVPTAAAGSSVTYNYTVTNNGPDIATSVRVQIPLDPALDNAGLTVPGGCVRDTVPNPDVLNCTIASLGVGLSQGIAVQGVVGAASGSTLTLNANVSVTNVAAPQDPINGNNNASVSTTITPGTTLGISKTRAPGGNPRFVGENITYTITPTYSGDAPTTLQIVDAMPAQTCFNGVTPYVSGGWTCSASSVCPASGATVTCTRPNPSGGGFNVPLGTITIPATLVAVGSPINTAQMTAAGGLNVSAGNAVTIQNPVSDFRANKAQDWPQNVIPTGQAFNYTLSATNLGPAPFASLLGGTPTTVLTDVVPAGVTINSITPNGFTCTTAPAGALPLAGPLTLTCTRTVANIALNANTANVVVNSTITTVGLKTNTVCVSTSGGPPDENPLPVGSASGNNCASVSLTGQDPIATIADVRTAKRVIGIGDAAGNRQLAGQPITYELEIINIGPGVANNVRVSDTFNTLINGSIGAGQGGESIANSLGVATGIVCSLVSTGGTSVALDGACNVGSLPICIAKPAAGANCPVITVVVRPAGDGTAGSNDYTRPNTVTAISISTADPTPSANSSSADAFLTARANITVLKSAVPAAGARIGQVLTYTVTVQNPGPSRAFTVSATDSLANGLTFLSATASGGGTCGTTPTVGSTTAAGNNSVVCSWAFIGGLGGQQTITIAVRPNQALFGGPAVPNAVLVATATPETNGADNTANITTTLADPTYNLIVNKVDSVDPVNIGDDTVYTVTGTNTAASVAENVRIIDTLPLGGSGGLTFQAIQNITPATGVCTTTATVGAQGGTVTCVFPGLRSASTAGTEPTAVSFEVRMRGSAKGSTSNRADIDMSNAAGTVVNAAQMAFEDPANNTTTITTTVRTKADVEVVSKQAVATGTATALTNIGGTQVFDWLVAVRNNGPDQADTVSFTDTLPAGMQLDGAPVFTVTAGTFVPIAPTCTGVAGGAGTTCTITSMSNGATATVRIPVRFVPANPAVGTAFINRASIITTGSGDTVGGVNPNGGNNFKDGTITVSALGSISGRVYHDLNGNGVFDAGEPGIQTTVTLSGTTNATLTSNLDGTYLFGSLPAGTYSVTETQPATFDPGITKPGTLVGPGTVGTVPGAGPGITSGPNGSNANVVQNITLAAGTNSPNNNFGEIRHGSLAGSVYHDVDASNTLNGGDIGIGGATVTLSGTDYFGNPVPAGTTATTAAGTGNYSFNNLTPGNYQLDETQPVGFGDRAETLGTSFATATGLSNGTINPGAVNDRIGTIQLESGFAGTGYNFGEITGSIAGQVYVDSSTGGGANNNNGNRDAGEAAIPGVTVRLQGTDVRGNAINVTTTTTATGAYAFTGLFPATAAGYTITEEGQAIAPLNTFNDGLDRLGNAATPGVLGNDTVTGVNITAGQNATGYDFGELPRATISGLVYIDRNINGSLDGVDTGRIPGVTLTLRTGNDCAAGTVVGVPVLTDGTGAYAFANVSAGITYVICETQPANFANGGANPGPSGAAQPGNNSIVITNLPATGSPNNNFGERGGALSGNVYVDRNNSGGAITAGEPGIPGVPVTLGGIIAGGGAFTPVTINTTPGGTYAFLDLPAGTYVVTEGAVPAPFTDGQETLGSVTAGSTPGVAGNDVFTGVVLVPGGIGTDYNFGERELATISGVVAIDRNRNNLLDPTPTDGRVPGAGVTITLRTGNDCTAGTVVGTTTTNATTGAYQFTGLDIGNPYVICETQPAGYGNGPALPGAGNTAQPGNNSIAVPSLAATGSTNNNFLELLGRISGQVYVDFGATVNPGGVNNNNGTREAGEAPLAGVTVTLTGADANGAVNRTTTTNAAGAYDFDDLFPATGAGYTITEQPGGPLVTFNDGKDKLGNAATLGVLGNDTVTGVNISAGQDATGYDFGELPRTAISGVVYVDRSRDGALQPATEPGRIGGVFITLRTGTDCSAGTVVAGPTATAPDGSYLFNGISAGITYVICEVQPTGYANGGANPGGPEGAAQPGNNSIVITNLPLAGSPNNNFGEQGGGLAGNVYVDRNNSGGAIDAGEPPIAGVPVTLSGTLAGGGAFTSITVNTSPTGAYSFPDLPAGTYVITEGVVPAPYTDGKETLGSVSAGSTAGVAGNDVFTGVILVPGGIGIDYNFGEREQATISGVVAIDRNRNNLVDPTPTDGRIPGAGVTITLRTGNDCAAGTVVGTTATDPSTGAYQFAGVDVNNAYVICETQPLGYTTGPALPGAGGVAQPGNNSISIALLPATGSANNNFLELLGSIAGQVYVDFTAGGAANNNNGARDAGEPGIANVTIRLTGIDTQGTTVNRTAVTNATGAYLFDDLFPATAAGYTLVEENGAALSPGLTGFNDGKDRLGNAATAGTLGNDTMTVVNISPAQQATGYDFGELPASAGISGRVYVDRNRDGTYVPSDDPSGLSGITIRLVRGTCAAGTVIGTTTTSASGTYSFPGGSVTAAQMSAGEDYTVCETQPLAYNDGSTNPGTNGTTPLVNEIRITNLPIAGSPNNNFGEQAGSIRGTVYLDANNNGVIDGATDTGFAGITVTLQGTPVGGGAPVTLTAITNATGGYEFLDLPAASYTITEQTAQPVAAAGTTLDGRTTAGAAVPGGTAGTASATTSTPSTISALGLPAGGNSVGNNFGEILPVSLAGRVYLDANNNGSYDAEPTFANIPIRITGIDDTGAPVTRTVQTSADGTFAVSDLRPGVYAVVEELQPPNTTNGITTPGTAGGTATPVITVPSAISGINLSLPGSASLNNLFGEVPNNSSLSGRVWRDNNNNGIQDGAELGIAGVTIELTGRDTLGNAVTRTATTDTTGAYLFDSLPTGTYTVREPNQPAGTLNGTTVAGSTGGTPSLASVSPSVISAITLGISQASINNNFGEIPEASIAGQVFSDTNNDGRRDPGEAPFAGETINLTGTDDLGRPVTLTTVTGSNGEYLFANLRPGTYTINQPNQPPGTVNGITTPGTTGGTASNPTPTSSRITPIVLAAGIASTGNNFGEPPNISSISGRVWRDNNNNGTQETTEPGIAGVTIELTGRDILGNPVTRTTITDSNGAYLFDNLAPGTYNVREPTQPTGTFNGRTVVGSTGGAATDVLVAPSMISNISLGINQASVNNNFGEIPGASVAGQVFNDTNNDGRRDTGEGPFVGETITLTGTDDLGQLVTLTTTTGSNGEYLFPNLRPGTYTVNQPNQPAGTVNGITTPGTTGGTATNPTPSSSRITPITVGPGVASTGNDFGELGDSPDLVVTKSNTPTTFTELNVGTYVITVRNIGSQPTNGSYSVTDRLPAGFTLAEAPIGTGWTCNGAAGTVTFTCSSSALIASGQTSPSTISVKVRVAAGVAARSPVNNAVLVEGGGERAGRGPTDAERTAFNGDVTALPICTDPASSNVCRRPTPVQESGGISGRVWLDTDHDRLYTPGTDIDKPAFIVEVRRGGSGDCVSGTLVGTTTTNERGQWELRGLIPTMPGDATSTYSVCFKDPVTGAYYGRPVSRDPAGGNDPTATGRPGVVAGGAINQVSVPGGNSVRINQDLPLDPNGVVYDSNTRRPVAGAVVQLIGPSGAAVPNNCLIGGINRMTTAVGQAGTVDGGYSFLLINPPPAGCPGNGTYTVQVTPPPGYLNAGTPSVAGNLQSTSTVIPAQLGAVSVPASCQSYVVSAPCAVQQLPTAPAVGQPTPYFFQFPITLGGVDFVNNHIPLDPQATTGLVISKVVNKPTVEVGDPVSYTVQVRNTANGFFPNVRVVDSLPAGFRYIPGTFRVGGVLAIDPAGAPGPQLTFSVGNLAPNASVTITYTLRAGVGSLQGDGINSAQAVSGVGSSVVSRSNIARARVKVTGGVFGNDGCVVGKVYVDCNNNHVQDAEELGIPGVRLYFEDGTSLISDSEGKYSLCGVSPRTHVLKVDPLTMPRGSRMTTSSSRNAADAGSLFIDMKNGELQRADFIEGSCSNTVLEQVKARRAQGEVRAPETERKRAPALKFEGKAPNYPQQGTDSANQPAVKPRTAAPGSSSQPQEGEAEAHTPVPTLPSASQNTQRK